MIGTVSSLLELVNGLLFVLMVANTSGCKEGPLVTTDAAALFPVPWHADPSV